MAPGIADHLYESLTYVVRVSDFFQAVEMELNEAEVCQSHPLAARQLRRGGGSKAFTLIVARAIVLRLLAI
eukprot:2184252-Pleurochrysis_carterae.AAC.1